MLRSAFTAVLTAGLCAGSAAAQPVGDAPQPVDPSAAEPERVDPVPSQPPPPVVESAPAEEAAAPEPAATAWFRFDADRLGTQIWAGATHSLGPVALAVNGIMRWPRPAAMIRAWRMRRFIAPRAAADR